MNRYRFIAAAALAALVLPACVMSSEPQSADPGEDAPIAAPPPVEDPDHVEMATSEETGDVRIKTPEGIIRGEYHVVDGHAFYQGDIDLGPISELDPNGERAVVTMDMSSRWPGGDIYYLIDGSISASQVTEIQAAMSTYEQLTPVRFHPGLAGLSNYIYFTVSGTQYVSSSNSIGMKGAANTLSQTTIKLWPTHTRSIVLHEIGHALGLFHEQSSPFRDAYVNYDGSCVTSGNASQFDKQTVLTTLTYTPYDVTSIMQYDSTSFCVAPLPGQPAIPGTSCKCFPVFLKGYTNTDPAGWIHRTTVLSVEDVNAVNHMYEYKLGGNEAGDKLGTTMVSADFDGDGYADLAVGAPTEAPGGGAASGAVFLYKGTYTGLIPWKVLTQTGLGSNEAGDQFGASLAAGDLDRDGIADLVVGAPGEAPGADPKSGAIFIFTGGPGGPSPWVSLDEGNTNAGINEAGDLFGTALSVGDFDGDGNPDLAVGTPGEAPPGGPSSGWVYVYHNTSTGLAFWTSFGQGGLETDDAGDKFGTALASGDFNLDGKADLAVGAPESGGSTGAGAVYLFKGNAAGPTAWTTLRQTAADAPAPYDAFGSSLAVGDFNGATYNGKRYAHLAIGASGKDNPTSSGRVYVFAPLWFYGAVIGMGQAEVLDQSAFSGNDTYDHLGQTMIAADFDKDGKDDLVVGVQYKDFISTDAGYALLYKGSSSLLQSYTVYFQPAPYDSASGDRFGASLAVGDFNKDGRVDLAVGAPGEAPDADPAGSGAFYTFEGQAASVPSIWDFYSQESLP